jgi:hypothetical protein
MTRIASCLLILACIAGRAHAQAEPDKAKVEADAAQKAYDDSKYSDAAAHFARAYELDPQVAYLYNGATAYRLAKDCANAAKLYRQFLDATKGVQVQNVDKVKRYLDEMDACAKATPKLPEKPPEQPAVTHTEPDVRTFATPEPADSGKSKRRLGLVVGASGVAVLGVGAGFGLAAMRNAELHDAFYKKYCHPYPGDACDGSFLQKQYDDPGHRDAVIAISAFAVGGAAVAGGIALYFMGRTSSEQPVAVAPAPGGAVVTTAFSF